jgi:aminopeptidase N
VERLCLLTGDEQLIEQALHTDPSASARVHAARARSKLPSATAKSAAWELLMRPSSTSAYEVYATAEGFFTPSQDELTAPFVPAYFAEIAETGRFRTGWALGEVAKRAYPTAASTPATLAEAKRALARTDLPAPVRRSLTDGTDRLARAVASRERFGR